MERAEAVKESHTATHAAVGRVVIDTLKGMKASPLRTQLDSFVAAADGVSRTAAASAIGESISNNRWHGAMQHAVCPGTGALPLPVERRSAMRVDKDAALRLLKLIKDSTQRCAFGTRILALRDGSTRTIANVDRRKTIKQITVEFLTEILAELDEEEDFPEERCELRDRASGMQCRSEAGHSGNCCFTPKGALSPSSIRRLVDTLTDSDICSLAGLDDTAVECGHDNWSEMRKIARCLSPLADGAEGGARLAEILGRIDEAEAFHQCDFARHLGRETHHACGCLCCGFHCEAEPVDCSLRDQHSNSCSSTRKQAP